VAWLNGKDRRTKERALFTLDMDRLSLTDFDRVRDVRLLPFRLQLKLHAALEELSAAVEIETLKLPISVLD